MLSLVWRHSSATGSPQALRREVDRYAPSLVCDDLGDSLKKRNERFIIAKSSSFIEDCKWNLFAY
jgi:hypothetical protein